MKVLPLIALFALVGVAGVAAESQPPAPLTIDDLTWSARTRDGSVEVGSNRGKSSVSIDRERLSEISGLDGDVPARFVVEAEAGRTECAGTRRGGRCRFVSRPAFETGLAQRDVALERRRDLLPLALVDARLALVDQLSREHLAPRTSGELIAATALRVTGAWAHGLREAGLNIVRFEDLLAARALNLDAAFVREMGAAGYPGLSAGDAITMKAVGVTPAYAVAMNRAVRAAHAVEGAGALQ